MRRIALGLAISVFALIGSVTFADEVLGSIGDESVAVDAQALADAAYAGAEAAVANNQRKFTVEFKFDKKKKQQAVCRIEKDAFQNPVGIECQPRIEGVYNPFYIFFKL